MKNIFFLNKFYTPKIINVIYWVSAVLYILVGLFLFIDGYDAEERLQGLFLFVFGPVLARVMAELTVVPFKIYDKVESKPNPIKLPTIVTNKTIPAGTLLLQQATNIASANGVTNPLIDIIEIKKAII